MTAPPTEAGGILRSPEAGPRVIRGGAIRAVGYGAGLVLGAATAVLLLRHLGLVDFGRYVTVMSLLGIVAGITDAGLTAVGGREMALRTPGPERRALLGNLVLLRLVTTLVGVAAAVAFAALAGYDRTMVLGTALGGLGIVALNVQTMMTMPLWVDLRIAASTALDVVKNALTLAGVALLVAAGATLLPFFAIPIAVGLAAIALTPLVVGRAAGLLPAFDRQLVRLLVREALPLAVAFAMSVIYFRVLVIVTSLVSDEHQTGLFATSFRIFEVLLMLPALVLAVALPVLSVAGQEDRERLRAALQRMTEVALLTAAFGVLLVAVLADAVIALLAGGEYEGAGGVLRTQAFALLFVFVAQTWQLALIAVRGQRALAIANGIALVVVLALGLALVPPFGAVGAAWAAIVAELVLAAVLFAFLRSTDRRLAPSFRFAWRVAVAAAAGAAAALVPGVPTLASAVLAGAVFVAVAFAAGAVPPEIREALLRRKAGAA